MQENRTITIDVDLWEKTQSELFHLRQKNAQLMARVHKLQSQNKKNGVITRHSMTPITQQSLSISTIEKKGQRQKFKNQMIQYQNKLNKRAERPTAIKIENRLRTVLNQIAQQKIELSQMPNQKKQQQQQEQKKQKTQQGIKNEEKRQMLNQVRQKKSQQIKSKEKKQMLNQVSQKKQQEIEQMKLIESICLFGPSQQSIIENIANKRMVLPNSLLYSANKGNMEDFKIYGEYFYPSGQIKAKILREQEACTQVNQIIFRKNTKKQDCSLFVFRGDENNNKLQKSNAMLSRLNPGKWLFAFFVQFSDYEFVTSQQDFQILQRNNKSLSQFTDDHASDKISGNQSQRIRSTKKKINQYVKGKYTLCIFTYFPIISVMEHLLSAIFDEIKIKRVEKFSQSNQMKEVCIKFFRNQLSEVASTVYHQIQLVPTDFSGQVGINFGNVKIIFDLSQQRFDDLIFSGWLYDTAKIFEKDLMYQLFTNLMTEQSIFFVCQNMHMLTYVVFFFVCVITNPFYYPHPCLSNVWSFELLQSPFICVGGINESSKWLEENVSNYPTKIFVDLNDEIKVKGKKKLKTVKSEKLKKIFNSLYKKIESTNSPVPQIFKKKETIIRPASKQQNLAAITFIKSLQNYYSEQLFIFLPNPEIITHIRDRISQMNETQKTTKILNQIGKYLRESRKYKDKDQFIDLLVQQQIFYVHMGTRYKLD